MCVFFRKKVWPFLSLCDDTLISACSTRCSTLTTNNHGFSVCGKCSSNRRLGPHLPVPKKQWFAFFVLFLVGLKHHVKGIKVIRCFPTCFWWCFRGGPCIAKPCDFFPTCHHGYGKLTAKAPKKPWMGRESIYQASLKGNWYVSLFSWVSTCC